MYFNNETNKNTHDLELYWLATLRAACKQGDTREMTGPRICIVQSELLSNASTAEKVSYQLADLNFTLAPH